MPKDDSKSVAQMRPGEVAVISGFKDNELAPKLLEMGFLPGSSVRFNFTAPFGDPVCVTVGGYELSLRLEEASTISILK
jgi:ferrous iron transport protein A